MVDTNDPTCYYAALREFKEETGFDLNHSNIQNTSIYYYGGHTVIYVIRSTQVFQEYNKDLIHENETDALMYIPLDELRINYNNRTIRDCVRSSLGCMFKRGYL